MADDVFGVDFIGDEGFGFIGRGGGALSGSELSHLRKSLVVSGILGDKKCTNIGMFVLSKDVCVLMTESLDRECCRSDEADIGN
jgi:hypothetical protein